MTFSMLRCLSARRSTRSAASTSSGVASPAPSRASRARRCDRLPEHLHVTAPRAARPSPPPHAAGKTPHHEEKHGQQATAYPPQRATREAIEQRCEHGWQGPAREPVESWISVTAIVSTRRANPYLGELDRQAIHRNVDSEHPTAGSPPAARRQSQSPFRSRARSPPPRG